MLKHLFELALPNIFGQPIHILRIENISVSVWILLFIYSFLLFHIAKISQFKGAMSLKSDFFHVYVLQLGHQCF